MVRSEQTRIENLKMEYFDEMASDITNHFFVFPQKGGVFANATLNLLDRGLLENERPIVQHSFFRDEHCQHSGYFEDKCTLVGSLFQYGTVLPNGPEDCRIAPLRLSDRQAAGTEIDFYITPSGCLSYAKRPSHIEDAVRVFIPVFFAPCNKLAIFASKRKDGKFNIIAVLNGEEVMFDQGLLDELAAS